MTTTTKPTIAPPTKPAPPVAPREPLRTPDAAPELGEDLKRMRREEEERIERQRLEELASLRELARFD